MEILTQTKLESMDSSRISSRVYRHRLALALVFESFMHDQIVEDCEFASAMPGHDVLLGPGFLGVHAENE